MIMRVLHVVQVLCLAQLTCLRLGLGFTSPVGPGRVLDVCLCLGCGGVGSFGSLGGVCGVGGQLVEVLGQGLERWGGVMSV